MSLHWLHYNNSLCKLAKYKRLIHSQKCKYAALVEKEKEDVRRRLIYSWQMKHPEEECNSAFYNGFEKFRSYLHRVWSGYDWDGIMGSQVEDIVRNGSEYPKHKYMKAAYNTPKNA
ncbi:hypothetical protein D8674_026269 [Pyrus ussuriensis x Pyrus communis]|uniref:Uncharacterized protein n=1 Tax=Pyrus ussuriensis x Pyrus communis TaxID=2448454 RepID=A0A5N5I6C6_9ROSA|nr:hypothetical protein D8674_026269 [Pyrus ussuriensis x Pyrus communis]